MAKHVALCLLLCAVLSQTAESATSPWPEYRGGQLKDGVSFMSGPAVPVANVSSVNVVTRLDSKGKLLSAPVLDEENNVIVLRLDGTLIMFSPSDTSEKSFTEIPLTTHPWPLNEMADCRVILSSIPSIKSVFTSQLASPIAVLGGGKAVVVSPVGGNIYFVNYKGKTFSTVALPDATVPSCFAPTVIDSILLVAVNTKDHTSGKVLVMNLTAVEQGNSSAAILNTLIPNEKNNFAFTSSISVGPDGVGVVPFTTAWPSTDTTANIFTFPTDPSANDKHIYAQVDKCSLPYLTNVPAAIWACKEGMKYASYVPEGSHQPQVTFTCSSSKVRTSGPHWEGPHITYLPCSSSLVALLQERTSFPATMKELWTTTSNAKCGLLSAVAVWENPLHNNVTVVVACEQNGVLFAYDGISYASGTHIWSRYIGQMVASPSVDKNGVIYIGTTKGLSESNMIFAVNITNGVVLWKQHAGTPVISTPIIGNDSSLHFSTSAGSLFRADTEYLATTAPPTSPPTTKPTTKHTTPPTTKPTTKPTTPPTTKPTTKPTTPPTTKPTTKPTTPPTTKPTTKPTTPPTTKPTTKPTTPPTTKPTTKPTTPPTTKPTTPPTTQPTTKPTTKPATTATTKPATTATTKPATTSTTAPATKPVTSGKSTTPAASTSVNTTTKAVVTTPANSTAKPPSNQTNTGSTQATTQPGTPTGTVSPYHKKSSGGLSSGGKAAIAICVIAAVAILAAVGYIYFKRRKSSSGYRPVDSDIN